MKSRLIRNLAMTSFALLAGVVLAGAASAATGGNAGDGDLLGKRHAAAGIKCAGCHGNAKKPQAVQMEQCLTCHGDTAKLAAKTAGAKPLNPHESRHYGTDADCNICHHQHRKSENFCLDCHPRFGFTVP
jgi:hypothetical protein